MKFEKYKKTAKPGEPSKENPLVILAKIFATVVYAWSGFFWAGATAYNFYFLTKEPDYYHLATLFTVGSLLVLVGIILCWKKRYVLQFPFVSVGTVLFLIAAGEMIDSAERTAVVFTPTFEWRYLPILAAWLVSLIFFAVNTYTVLSSRKQVKDDFNNSPAKSILDD